MTISSKPSESTLARTPGRTLTFLLGVASSSVIRGLLEDRGYTTAEHEHGWSLLRAADPLLASNAGGSPAPSSDAEVRQALAKLDAWDNDNLPIADVALRRRQPEAHALLFAGELAPAEGIASVDVVEKFITRLDQLSAIATTDAKAHRAKKSGATTDDAAPSVTREQASAALSILATRGITDDERNTVKSWLATVRRGAAPVKTNATDDAARAASTEAALVELYEWHREWVLVLTRATKRRSHLITVGAAERKSPAKKPAEPKTPTK